LKKYIEDYTFLAFVTGIIVAADQWTKALVRANVAYGEQWAPWPWLLPYIRIVHIENTGAAFGMFQNFGDVFRVLAILVSIAIIYYFPQVPRQDWWMRLAMGMQCGGAIGNAIDRITRGPVTDFISVGTFAIFNVADSCISVGTAVLLLGVWINERRQKPPVLQPPSETGESTSPAVTPSASEDSQGG
jgi:signal peptidase II